MNDLINQVQGLQQRLLKPAAVKESLEWYLKNNLADFEISLQGSNAQEMERASRTLLRFCTESMDWDMPLYRDCLAIAQEGLRLAKLKSRV